MKKNRITFLFAEICLGLLVVFLLEIFFRIINHKKELPSLLKIPVTRNGIHLSMG